MDPNEPADRQAAQQQLNGPIIGILVTGGLGALTSLISMVANLFTAGASPFADRGDSFAVLVSGVGGIVFALIGLGVSGFVIWGALQMKRMDSYGLALTTSIVAMVPCLSPCCIVGLPFGVWALVVMHKPEVRSAFRA